MTYADMVERAAELLLDTGVLDLVALAEAGAAGFDVETFAADVTALAETNAAFL